MIFDVPRINTEVRNSLVTVTNSTVIYNTDNNRYEYYNGTSWKPFGEGGVISFNTRTGEVTLLDSDIASLGDFTISGTVTVNNDIILGSQALKIATSSTDPNVSGVAGNIGSVILKNDGSMWQKDGSSNTDWSQVQTGEYSNEPTGFPIDSVGEVDRTSSTISFVDGVTRTFSIAPTSGSYIILIKGRQYRKTTTESIQISNTEGTHYIYFDENGELHETTSFSLEFILKYVAVAIIYWNASTSKALLFGDERHGCTMDAHTHARIHADSGAVYVSGMSITDLVVGGAGNSELDLTFGVTQGSLRDEDILHNLSSRTINQPIRVIYKEGTNWRFTDPTAVGGYYARAVGSSGTPGVIAYNYNNAGTWSRVSISNGNYVLYHLVATNDINNPYIIIMGINQYDNKPAAKAGAIVEIGTLTGLPFAEMTLVATMMYVHSTGDTNSLKAALTATNNTDYEDWRFSKTLNPTTAAINNHNNLGGIYGGSPFYHSDQPITTTDSVTFHAINSSTTLDVSGTSTLATTNMTTGNVSGALNVTGTSTLTTANITTGNISGALNVTGISTQTTINMTNGNISNALNVTGTSTLATTNMTIGNVSGALNVTGTSTFMDVNLSGGLVIGGNLTVNGTTTTVNSIITTLEDPIIVLGKSSPTTDDNKDRGIAFNYHTGSSPKTGYFGYQDSTGKLIYIPDATITNEVVSGNKGTIDAYLDWSNLTAIPDYLLKIGGTISGNLVINGDLTASTGTSTFKTVNITDNIGIGGTLNVTGTSTQNTINFTNGNISGALNVTGTSTLKNITASGTVIVNGLTYPSGDGTPNQVLKTDGSGQLSFSTITQDHNLLTNIQGGGGGNYYHSNQPINTTDNVSFNNLTVVSGVNVTGSIKLNNIIYPTSDGSSNQVLKTDGIGNLTFGTITQDHSLLTNVSGGAGGNYYHSDQPINTTDSVEFSDLKIVNEFSLYGLYNNDGLTGDITSSIFSPQNSTFSIAVNSATTFHGIGWLGNTPQGKILLIRNTSTSTIITIANQSTTETSASARIITGTNSNYSLAPNASVLLFYDGSSLRWKIIGQNSHNLFSDLQGGGGGNYYHSNQPINSTDNVTFNNLTVVSGVNVTGSVKLNNITYPSTDGSNGQVMTTDGSGNISFTTVASGTAASGTILDTYINSKTVEINNNSSSNIQTIFSQAISGIYTFWVSTDPRIKGTFYFNENDPSNSVLESISSSVSSKQDNAGTLNIYISSVNVIIQNKLGSNITLCIRRETTPLINPEPGNVSISSHNNLYDLQGGGTNTYYHSNQPINMANTVTFAGISIPLVNINSSGTINDLSTDNIGGYRFNVESSTTITGFANGNNGKLLYLHNIGSANITIKNNSTSSDVSNRILTGTASDLILKPDKAITLQYDSLSSKWRILGGSGGNPSENPETLDLSNSPSTIDFSQYSTTSFRIKNPAQITLTSGTNGVWYTLAIVSDGNYSFTSETRFPLNNAQPVPSSGTVDLYTFHCIDTVSGTRYLATFAYDYNGVTLP